MKKIGKKIAAMLCMLSTAIPSNIKAKDSKSYSISEYTISSSNKKYEQMFIKATSGEYLKFLSGYTTKKDENNPEKEFVTGKIELVPIVKEHYYDWMKIVDCFNNKNREYIKKEKFINQIKHQSQKTRFFNSIWFNCDKCTFCTNF